VKPDVGKTDSLFADLQPTAAILESRVPAARRM